MMKQYSFSWSAALMAVGVGALAWAGPEAVQNVQKPALSGGPPVVFGFGGEGNQEFMLNGKPFQIRGAEMHPQRIPREYWRHRIRTFIVRANTPAPNPLSMFTTAIPGAHD